MQSISTIGLDIAKSVFQSSTPCWTLRHRVCCRCGLLHILGRLPLLLALTGRKAPATYWLAGAKCFHAKLVEMVRSRKVINAALSISAGARIVARTRSPLWGGGPINDSLRSCDRACCWWSSSAHRSRLSRSGFVPCGGRTGTAQQKGACGVPEGGSGQVIRYRRSARRCRFRRPLFDSRTSTTNANTPRIAIAAIIEVAADDHCRHVHLAHIVRR